jgi:transposase
MKRLGSRMKLEGGRHHGYLLARRPSAPDQVLEALRLRSLRGCELGFAHADIAHMLGVCPETVSRWWTAYSGEGLDARPQERTGRPLGSGRILNDEQARRAQHLIDSKCPEELGITCPLWSRRAVRDLIVKEFGIHLPVRSRSSASNRMTRSTRQRWPGSSGC